MSIQHVNREYQVEIKIPFVCYIESRSTMIKSCNILIKKTDVSFEYMIMTFLECVMSIFSDYRENVLLLKTSTPFPTSGTYVFVTLLIITFSCN